MAQKVNVPVYRGESALLQFGPPEGQSPIGISGWSMRFIVHPSRDDNTALITKTTGGGGIAITNGAADELEVTLTAADLNLLPPKVYHCHLWRSNVGAETMMAEGPFHILAPRVT